MAPRCLRGAPPDSTTSRGFNFADTRSTGALSEIDFAFLDHRVPLVTAGGVGRGDFRSARNSTDNSAVCLFVFVFVLAFVFTGAADCAGFAFDFAWAATDSALPAVARSRSTVAGSAMSRPNRSR